MPTGSSERPSPAANLPENSRLLDEALLTALFAGVSEAIYIEELESRQIVYWSSAAAASFGYGAGRILRQSSAIVCVDDSADLQTRLDKSGIWRGRRAYRRASGETFEASVCATLWRSADRSYVVNAVSVPAPVDQTGAPQLEDFADTQSFRVAEQSDQLQRGAERWQGERMIGQILRHVINDALFTTNVDGEIVDWNDAASRLLGYERGEVCRRSFLAICPAGEEQSAKDILRQTAERGRAHYTQWLTRKDGKLIYASVAAFALGGGAQPQGALFLVRDHSRERSLKQKLREREQMAAIGTAASMLAHEIGNPLNGISATVQLLEHFVGREKPTAAQMMLSSIQDLKSEIQRLTILLNEFKNIAWPQKLALAPVDVPRLIRDLVGSIEKRVARQGIAVSVDCQPELPSLEADAEKLGEALLHVLENAVEAMPNGGRLELKAYHCDDSVCIDISDTGVGIPENVKVFDLFSSTKPHGTGFGLFVVRQIVFAHEGTITYSSTPGQGTTFHLAFHVRPSPESLGDEFVEAL